MTRFEQNGVDRQYYSRNMNEANKSFEKSCTRCSTSGRQLDCDRCKIAFVHDIMVDYFKSKSNNTKLIRSI